MKDNCWIADFYFWKDKVYSSPGYSNTLTLYVTSLHTVAAKGLFFFLNRMIKGNTTLSYRSIPIKTKITDFPVKKWYLYHQIATSLGRENYLHAEEGKCQTGEESICYGGGYNYLMHLNTTGHWSYTGYFARSSVCRALTWHQQEIIRSLWGLS